MGCFSPSRKVEDIRPEEKWDFISLNDFKSKSVFTAMAYAYLWLSLVISVAVYGVDTFTAVNLLAFNKWSSEISPAIPIDISKWIFSICIILSWVNLGFEWLRAIRVMRRGSVAESYLDSLAVRIESIRLTHASKGWKRFLVFAELTKSKQGAEYVALFTYFSFQAWIRIIFCSGPRQVVNALTLWSVFQAKLEPDGGDVGSAFVQFFDNIAILAEENTQQAVVLSGMLFTLVIWVVQAISLIAAGLCFLFFLWHWIPNRDGGLSGYCQRKINQRLNKIVSVKVNKALEKEEQKRVRADKKAFKNGEKPLGRQATLPQLFDPKAGDSLPQMPMLHRNDTMTTLPQYSSRPGTPSSQIPKIPEVAAFEMATLDSKRRPPVMGNDSYSSDAPLLSAAAGMGYSNPARPATPGEQFGPPARSMTGSTMSSQMRGPTRVPTNQSMNGPARTMTANSMGNAAPTIPDVGMPLSQDAYGRPLMAPGRTTPMNAPGMGPGNGRYTPNGPGMGPNMTPFSPNGPPGGRMTPMNGPGGLPRGMTMNGPGPMGPPGPGRTPSNGPMGPMGRSLPMNGPGPMGPMSGRSTPVGGPMGPMGPMSGPSTPVGGPMGPNGMPRRGTPMDGTGVGYPGPPRGIPGQAPSELYGREVTHGRGASGQESFYEMPGSEPTLPFQVDTSDSVHKMPNFDPARTSDHRGEAQGSLPHLEPTIPELPSEPVSPAFAPATSSGRASPAGHSGHSGRSSPSGSDGAAWPLASNTAVAHATRAQTTNAYAPYNPGMRSASAAASMNPPQRIMTAPAHDRSFSQESLGIPIQRTASPLTYDDYDDDILNGYAVSRPPSPTHEERTGSYGPGARAPRGGYQRF